MQQDLSSLPPSRAKALEAGEKFYFTGRPCGRGHIEKRYSCNKQCVICYSEKRREKYLLNREREKASVQEWRSKNREHLERYARAYYQANKVNRKRNCRSWQIANGDICARKASEYRARLKRSVPKWYSELDDLVLDEAFALSSMRSETTRVGWDVDHLIPLASEIACGLHCGSNIQVIPRVLNQRKSNKMILTEPGQWINAL